MKRLIEFLDVTATALLMAALLAGFYWLGTIHAQTAVKAQCDGLNLVLLAGQRYECISMPKQGSEP